MKTLQQSVDRHTHTLFRGMVITIMCFPVQELAEERGQGKGHLSGDVVGGMVYRASCYTPPARWEVARRVSHYFPCRTLFPESTRVLVMLLEQDGACTQYTVNG